ncbi:hypothetical protein D9M70_382500 [compost metagenome]
MRNTAALSVPGSWISADRQQEAGRLTGSSPAHYRNLEARATTWHMEMRSPEHPDQLLGFSLSARPPERIAHQGV